MITVDRMRAYFVRLLATQLQILEEILSMIVDAAPAGVVKKVGNVRVISPLEIALAFPRLKGD
jgi:hypothetical protein